MVLNIAEKLNNLEEAIAKLIHEERKNQKPWYSWVDFESFNEDSEEYNILVCFNGESYPSLESKIEEILKEFTAETNLIVTDIYQRHDGQLQFFYTLKK